MNTENKAALEASDRAALNCSIGMSLGDDLIVGEQIEFSDFLKEVRSCYNPESISDNSFLFVQKRVDNLMYYAWCFKEVYGCPIPCLLVCYNSVMLSPASLESVSKTIAQMWYNIVNISDTLTVAVEQVKRIKEQGLVEQILQQQDYSYLPLYDYSTKPTNTSLDSFSTDKIEKAAQTNSRICILWNQPQVQTKTESKSKRRLWLRRTMVLVGIAGVVLGIVVTYLNYRQNSPIVYKGEIPQSTIETIVVNGVEFNMVKIDGGTFHMGATSEQDIDYDDEKPVHSVTLSDYYIGETEVTQELWEAVMGSNPSWFQGDNQRPVESVSWNDCQEFIKKLNQLTGKQFRLPTEAEWEYAARGGKYSRGYMYSGSNNADEVAWYCQNSGDKYLSWEWNYGSYDSIIENNNCKTHPVATKKANELGLYDMSGNVEEWCNDRYGDYQSNSQTNPTGPSKGEDRVSRGSSWYYYDMDVRVSNRNYDTPDNRYTNFGLRLAL